MNRFGALLLAIVTFVAVAATDQIPKGPASKNLMSAPCQKCSGVVVKLQPSSSS